MQKISIQIILFSFCFFVAGCSSSSKINALKPEADDAIPLVYENYAAPQKSDNNLLKIKIGKNNLN